ncbi:tetratricopeptide repeat protein [Candidatus Peregrinibacteria bacterium]|nr:MAG: tetratricopeptide repeat protein [Candidatus Peregrinibacteria bacterium]
MLALFLLLFSGFALSLMFLRRLRLTQQDLKFQEKLLSEERGETASEALEDFPLDSAEAPLEHLSEASMATAPKPELPRLEGGVRKAFLRADVFFGRNQLDEAEPLFLAILAEEPTHLDAHHKLGLLYLKRGDFPSAELYFSKLVNLKQDPVYFSNLGIALYQQQRLVEAAEAYENAIALDERRAERLQSLAQVYFELGEDEKALHYFERAARRKPKDETLKLILADYYERMGDVERAKKMLEELLDMDPYNEEIKSRWARL